MKNIVSNANWKAVKVGTEFVVTDEIHAILDKKNYFGEVKKPLIDIVTEPEPEPKAKK